MIRGLVTSSVETLDSAVTEEVTNHLLEDTKVPFSGMDLISLNIQRYCIIILCVFDYILYIYFRARDHGLQPYNEYRQLCNLTKAVKFEDLLNEIPQSSVDRLKKVYE